MKIHAHLSTWQSHETTNHHHYKTFNCNSKLLSLLAKRKTRLKYKIHNLLIQQMCWHAKSKQQLFSTRPAGTDFTLRLYREINFHPRKEGQVSASICLQKTIDSYWFKKVHKMTKFDKDNCWHFSQRLTSYQLIL